MSSDACTSSDKTDVPSMTLLKEAMSKTIEKCLSPIRFPNFCEHYSPIASKHPQKLRDICDLMKTQIRDHMQEEVKLIFEEENVEESLKKLESLEEAQSHKKGTLAWRPSGNPRVDLADHYRDIKQKHIVSLKKHLRSMEARNEQLNDIVLRRREEVLDLYAKAQDGSKQLDKVMTTIESLPTAQLEEKLELM